MNPSVKAMHERIAEAKSKSPPPMRNIHKRHSQNTLKLLPPDAVCQYCGMPLDSSNATIDHVIPLSRGGTDTPDNKVWACKTCNHRKGDLLPYELPEEFKNSLSEYLDALPADKKPPRQQMFRMRPAYKRW